MSVSSPPLRGQADLEQYCYRCGNAASILEVGPGGTKHFNVFDAAPENERDGPAQHQAQQQQQRVSDLLPSKPFP
jgi:hypothetical protein